MEPYYYVEVQAPADCVSAVYTVLARRRWVENFLRHFLAWVGGQNVNWYTKIADLFPPSSVATCAKFEVAII